MFEEIFFPRTAEKYRAGPLVEQRERYLVHLKGLGAARSTLRKCANDQLSLVRLLNLQEDDRVSTHRLEAAATNWSRPNGRRSTRSASPKTRTRFVGRGIEWLRFVGWLDEPEREPHPHQAEIAIFESWLRQERGLSRATIRDYCHAADHFFFWLGENGVRLSAVRMTDIDGVIAAEHKRGAWSRRTTHDYAQRLRAFFRFAEARGWCGPGLAAGIMAPRFLRDETVPKGLRREDVLRLLASVQGNRPIDKRDRAILMLFVAYGLRAGEVSGLRLDDLDWEGEILRVRCPKPGRVHSWPLSQEVGHAILRYVREARPSGFGRILFFTSRAPIRPLDRKSLGMIVRHRLAGISEAAQLKVSDLQIGRGNKGHDLATLHGKGGRTRQCPLWPETERVLAEETRGRATDDAVFVSRLGAPFTRFGVYRLIERCAARLPELADRTITPHVIRHTTACHLVLAGVDINTIRAWLGHVSISTTNIYAEIDLTLKANAVALCEVGQPRPSRSWKEDKDLMAFLKSL